MKGNKIAKQGSLLLLTAFLLIGCQSQEKGVEKIRDLKFTVVTGEAVPEEIRSLLQDKKQYPFKMTYTNNENTYIMVGYGRQETGGYSIAVKELFLAKNAVYIKTTLTGPGKEERQDKVPSYPYVVVKTDTNEEMVVFK